MSSSIDQNVYQIHPHIMYYQQHQQQMNNAALLQQQLLHQQYHDVSSNFLSVTKLDWFYTNQPYGPLFRKIFVLPYPRRSLFGYFCETNQMARHHCDKKYVALVSCHNNATIFFDVVDLIHDISLIVELILDHLLWIIAQDGLSHFTNQLSPKSSDL